MSWKNNKLEGTYTTLQGETLKALQSREIFAFRGHNFQRMISFEKFRKQIFAGGQFSRLFVQSLFCANYSNNVGNYNERLYQFDNEGELFYSKNIYKVVNCGILFNITLYWTLEASRTESYKITLIRLSIYPSVTKFSQYWISSFFWYCT